MKTWVTSDLHLNHTNILKFCPESRPFSDVKEMNEKIISNWNEMVSEGDTVYILGDVGFGSTYDTNKALSRMNGNKVLIIGNHDHKNLNVQEFKDNFIHITSYHTHKVDGKMVIMFHFPIEFWDQRHRGSFHLHGHQHSKNPLKLTQRRWDVGLDGNDCKVYNIQELIKHIENVAEIKENKSHHRGD